MKKSAFLSIVCTLFVLTALTSCSMSPDMMLQQYNDKLYEDIGGGVILRPDGIYQNPKLLPRDTYAVKESGTYKLKIATDYMSYKWILKDTTNNKNYTIEGFYIVYIGRPNIELKPENNYVITLLAESREGLLFTDSATIKVLK